MASIDEQLSATLALVESLQAEHAAKIADGEKALAEVREMAAANVASIVAERDTLAAQVAELTAKVTALETEKSTAEAKAAQIVAASAAIPADVSGVSQAESPKTVTRDDILAEFRSISDPSAKAAFYNAHWKAIAGL
jgi:peptidoglycan hydrolase CwlO-like protein